MMRFRGCLSIGAVLAAMVSAGPAQAVRFSFSGAGGGAVDPALARSFDVAAAYWSSILRDDVEVRIALGTGAVSGGALAATATTKTVVGVRDTYARLAADATTALDRTAVSRLTPLSSQTGGLTMRVNGFLDTVERTGYSSTATRMDADGSQNNMALSIATANARALGFAAAAEEDGTIILNDRLAFDGDPRNGIAAGHHDLIGIALREIGRVLGFQSGVDDYDGATGARIASGQRRTAADAVSLERAATGSVLDLYRYNAAGRLDWSTSPTTKYFSIDGRRGTLGGTFASGTIHGDGSAAGQWSAGRGCGAVQGIMGARACAGTMDHVTALDVAAFDAIGWNASFDALARPGYRISTASLVTMVPEPAAWLQMMSGFGVLGLAARGRRRRRRAASARS